MAVRELDLFLGFTVILLVFLLFHSHSHFQFIINLKITTSRSCNLLKQYIISRLCDNLILCCVKFSYFNFDAVYMELLNLPLETFYLTFRQFTCFKNTPELACQVFFLQLKQSIVFLALMHSLSIANIWSFLRLKITQYRHLIILFWPLPTSSNRITTGSCYLPTGHLPGKKP